MTRSGSILVALALVSATAGGARLSAGGGQPPQERPIVGNPAANNPHLGKADSIRSGMALYRIRCADCHGMDATGYRGPDLTALLATDVSDERLFHTLRKGVPGTEMPSSDDPDDDLLLLIAYLRKLATAGACRKNGGERRKRRAVVRRPVRELPSRGHAVAAGSVRT